MSISIGELFVELGVDATGLKGADKKIRAFSTRAERSFTRAIRVTGALTVALAGVGAGLFAKSLLDAGNVVENMSTRLEVMLGSVEEGNRLFNEMTMFAGRVPFELEEIMQSATMLAGIMRGGVDEISQWMPLIGDLAATTGLTIQETTEQVMRMLSAGAASADKFRERGVNAMLGFQAGVSYTAEQTRKQLLEQWTKTDSMFRGATEKLASTWAGLMSMLADKWFKFRTDVLDSGVFEALKKGASLLNDELQRMFETGEAKAFAKVLGENIFNTMIGLIRAVSMFRSAWTGVQMLWPTLKLGFLEFHEAVLDGLITIQAGTIKLLESINVFGKFDGMIDQLHNLENASITSLGVTRQQLILVEKELSGLLVQFNAEVITAEELIGKLTMTFDTYAEKSLEAATKATDAVTNSNVAIAASNDELRDRITKGTERWSSSVSDAMTDFALTGENTFQQVADNFASMITSMSIQSKVIEPLMSAIPGFDLFGSAKGNAFNNGNVMAFAKGGVVSSPTVFPMANGAGLMGEAGPEAVMPLSRNSKGQLGVLAGGGGGIVVNITNNTNSQVSAQKGNDGQRLDIIIDEIMSDKVINGRTGSALRKNFGLTPSMARR